MMYDRLIERLDAAVCLSESDKVALRGMKLEYFDVSAGIDLEDAKQFSKMHMIVAGIACRYKIYKGGNRHIVSLLLPGDLCNGHIPLAHSPGTHIGTLTQCLVAVLPLPAVQTLIAQHPQIAKALWWNTLLKMSVSHAWIENMGRCADKRLAHLICELYVRYEAVGLVQSGSFELDITQGDIGDIVGISAVHVCRVLRKLKQMQMIWIINKRIGVPSLKRLSEFAEFDPVYLLSSPPTSGDCDRLARRR